MKRGQYLPSTLWVEPPVSKEDALNPFHSPTGAWVPDGFDEANGGAAELPDDFDVDRMLYPHAEGPNEKASRQKQFTRDEDAEGYRSDAIRRSRDFDITVDAKTGKKGPPSPFGDDEK